MISKNHRQNHDFQIIHFLVGSCHTPDAAYALLCDLKEEREMAIESYHVSKIREKVKRLRLLNDTSLDAEADLLELDNNSRRGEVLYQAAQDELKFINDCIDKIQPSRKYKHLSDSESCQAMQREEWKLELIRRAENFLLTCGTIPADHFDTMRMHPDFITEILPQIEAIRSNGPTTLLKNNVNLLEI